MIKLLHTADWHLGLVSQQLEPDAARRLARARLDVVERILGEAEQYDVHAVLCAGDLFDVPAPERGWWSGLAELLRRRCARWARPVVLLPGNHDPLTASSVWSPDHAFRRDLPACVRVVDRDDFSLPLGPDAVVYAAPCRSQAGERDLALSLPARAPDDARLRVGLVHGSTFDLEGWQTVFPVAKDAALRRGLDYLAIGDTHAFRDVTPDAPAPTVYPGAPEPTSWAERDAGLVALVTLRHGRRAQVQPLRVGRWTWREVVARRMDEVRALLDEELTTTVLRLVLDLDVSLDEHLELERLLAALEGTPAAHARAGAVRVERRRVGVVARAAAFPPGLAPVLRDVVLRLEAEGAQPGPEGEAARRALVHLHRLVVDASAEAAARARSPAAPAGAAP